MGNKEIKNKIEENKEEIDYEMNVIYYDTVFILYNNYDFLNLNN